jgi:hypothetical protein
MHVQYVAICDQIIQGGDGRPSLINVFNDLAVPQVPLVVPRMAFAARIMFTQDEANRPHRVEVVITDPSGAEIGRPGGEISLPPLPPGIDALAVDLPLPIDMFDITSTGRYTFLLHIDGKPTAAVQLTVRQVQVS